MPTFCQTHCKSHRKTLLNRVCVIAMPYHTAQIIKWHPYDSNNNNWTMGGKDITEDGVAKTKKDLRIMLHSICKNKILLISSFWNKTVLLYTSFIPKYKLRGVDCIYRSGPVTQKLSEVPWPTLADWHYTFFINKIQEIISPVYLFKVI